MLRASRSVIGSLAAAAIALGAVGCTAEGADRTPLQHVVIHTDMGADDLIALMYLLSEPRVVVDAVIVAGDGVTHRDPGVANARAIVSAMRAGEIPVAGGSTEPSSGRRAFPSRWRASADHLYGLQLPLASPGTSGDGVATLIRAVLAAPAAVTLVELAPLTDLATALAAAPSIDDLLARVVVMGGALRVPGNVASHPDTEWNFYVDPGAARAVAASGVPIVLVPLDATNAVPLTTYFLAGLRQHLNTTGVDRVYQLLKMNGYLLGGSYLWDPLAAALAVDPSTATLRTVPLRIDPSSGRTSIGAGTEVQVATDVDGAAVQSRLVAGLSGDASARIRPPGSELTATAHRSSFSLGAADPVRAGAVAVDLRNERPEDVVVFVLRLHRGRTWSDVADLVRRGVTAPPSWLTVAATVTAAARTDWLWTIELPAGDYAVVGAAQSRPPVPEPVGPLHVDPRT